MEIPLLQEIVTIFALSILVLLACHWLRVPTIVGFLITGVLCGPHGLALVDDLTDVQILAEIGIIFLLFTVGLEVSIKRILEFKRLFLIGGPFQVLLTTIGGFCIAKLFGRPIGESVFLGFLLSLSSTAIVLRMLQERGETNTPHGRFNLGILIFQDIIIVPMMLITPLLAGKRGLLDPSIFYLFVEGILILALTFFLAVRIIPKLLYYVARTRSRELFILTVLVICFGVAWLTSSVGLSLALGAFLAGMIISESEYSFQAIGDILPIQDIFTNFFFVSIGMLLDIEFFIKHPFLILAISIGVYCLKSFVVLLTSFILGMPLRTAVLSGMALSQVGEFSFVLATVGIDAGIGTEYLHQLFLSVAVITMGVTPTLINISHKVANILVDLPLPQKMKTGLQIIPIHEKEKMQDHVIIIGFGFTGRNLARSSSEAGVPYVVIDMNPETVRREKKNGVPIYFGDATRELVLKHLHVNKAKVIAVVVNDSIAALRIVEKARQLNETAYIVARTRFIEEMQPMFQLGADDVITDEFGSSVEIFTRVLRYYDTPVEKIEELIAELRAEGYEMMRYRYMESTVFSGIRDYITDVSTNTFAVGKQSLLAGKTLEECDMRKKYGLTVIMIRRGDRSIYEITPKTELHVDDLVVVMGAKKKIKKAAEVFNP